MVTRSPMAGRLLSFLGILLCAFSLRSAVASLSPVLDHVAADFTVPTAVIGLIGTAPPVCFAIFGLCAPLLERRIGIEGSTAVALAAIAAGLVLRGFANDATALLVTTGVIFAGVGMGNILIPPLVKKYFPDRMGMMLTLYTTAISVSTFLPPLVAVPVADAAGWRISLGVWGVFAIAGVIPWIVMMATGRTAGHPQAIPAAASDDSADVAPMTGPIAVATTSSRVFARLLRLPLAWAIAVVFSTSSIMAYVFFAWFPSMVVDIVGVSAIEAGLLLSLFAVMSLPASLLVPVLVVRFGATLPVYLVGSAAGLLGVAGLAFWSNPVTVWLWTGLFGLVGVMFPLALVLISIRSRTPESAVALSSFVQSAGYVIAATFPLVIGILHEATMSWTVPLLVIAGVLVVSIPFGIIASRPRTVEEEWERRHGRW